MSPNVLIPLTCLLMGASGVPAPATAAQEAQSLWGRTPMAGLVTGLRGRCEERGDAVACVKFEALRLIDDFASKDDVQVSDSLSLVKNSGADSESDSASAGSGEGRGLEDVLASYVRSHDIRLRLPRLVGGQTLTVSPRNIDRDEITVRMSSDDEGDDESEAQVEGKSRKRRKNKLKKILVPILVFVLLKAMTLIPLAIGVLGLKAWNALQLSFFSFLISISLAMFQLFKKIASSDGPPPAAAIHAAPWQDYAAAARTLVLDQSAAPQDASSAAAAADAQSLAYSAYAQ